MPGLRTIPPSPVTRRHKIASIGLKNVQLSHVLVPKLREAAFLKVRARNTSSITLLKGPAGLTLDGSFLGNTTLPRCSAGDTFSLNLGVDPGVTVAYQKLAVRRSETGLFQKEGSCVSRRAVVVTNAKGNAHVLEGVMLDQVPVSEDEKLRVQVLQLRGLRNEGDTVASGTMVVAEAEAEAEAVGKSTSVRATGPGDGARGGPAAQGNEGEKWGKAVAVLKKGGEVCWNLKLNPGYGVRLALEYEAKFPGSEKVVSK